MQLKCNQISQLTSSTTHTNRKQNAHSSNTSVPLKTLYVQNKETLTLHQQYKIHNMPKTVFILGT